MYLVMFSPACTSGRKPSSSAHSGQSHAAATNGKSCSGWCLESSQTSNYNWVFSCIKFGYHLLTGFGRIQERQKDNWRGKVFSLPKAHFISNHVPLAQAVATALCLKENCEWLVSGTQFIEIVPFIFHMVCLQINDLISSVFNKTGISLSTCLCYNEGKHENLPFDVFVFPKL